MSDEPLITLVAAQHSTWPWRVRRNELRHLLLTPSLLPRRVAQGVATRQAGRGSDCEPRLASRISSWNPACCWQALGKYRQALIGTTGAISTDGGSERDSMPISPNRCRIRQDCHPGGRGFESRRSRSWKPAYRAGFRVPSSLLRQGPRQSWQASLQVAAEPSQPPGCGASAAGRRRGKRARGSCSLGR